MSAEVRENEREGIIPKASWLDDTLRQFNFVAMLRERNQVKQTCAQALQVYRRIAAESPASSNTDRYQRVIGVLTGADANGIRVILRRVEQSFASWPVDRDLVFRDVVAYFAITNILKADISAAGVRARVMDIVADAIPKNT